MCYNTDHKMDVLSEQEVEVGSNFVGSVGEFGVGKECFAVEAEIDAHNTPTEKGG